MIAALFVETNGCYFGLPDVDPWDKERDARLYAGPCPVVAHPPCQLWVNFAALNYKRWGGEHNRPGNDGGCFKHALWCVRKFGGVLEHPAFSNAWSEFGLTKPTGTGWTPGTHQVGWFDRIKPTLGKKAANATPPAFRDVLLDLARHSRGERRAA